MPPVDQVLRFVCRGKLSDDQGWHWPAGQLKWLPGRPQLSGHCPDLTTDHCPVPCAQCPVLLPCVHPLPERETLRAGRCSGASCCSSTCLHVNKTVKRSRVHGPRPSSQRTPRRRRLSHRSFPSLVWSLRCLPVTVTAAVARPARAVSGKIGQFRRSAARGRSKRTNPPSAKARPHRHYRPSLFKRCTIPYECSLRVDWSISSLTLEIGVQQPASGSVLANTACNGHCNSIRADGQRAVGDGRHGPLIPGRRDLPVSVPSSLAIGNVLHPGRLRARVAGPFPRHSGGGRVAWPVHIRTRRRIIPGPAGPGNVAPGIPSQAGGSRNVVNDNEAIQQLRGDLSTVRDSCATRASTASAQPTTHGNRTLKPGLNELSARQCVLAGENASRWLTSGVFATRVGTASPSQQPQANRPHCEAERWRGVGTTQKVSRWPSKE